MREIDQSRSSSDSDLLVITLTVSMPNKKNPKAGNYHPVHSGGVDSSTSSTSLNQIRSERIGITARSPVPDMAQDIARIKADMAQVNQTLIQLMDKMNSMNPGSSPPSYQGSTRLPGAFLSPNKWI